MEYKDYYKILGVNKDATKDEIKKAYRKLARQHHPDINPHNKKATAQFADINEAHEVLSNDEKRRKYDTLGADWQQYREGSESYVFSGDDLNDVFGEGGFSDFFQNIFGSRQGKRQSQTRKFARKGQDYQAELLLDMEEAYTKTVKTITLNGQNLRLTLEPGTRDNQIIKLKGKGGPGVNGGENGDLYITLRLKPHPLYKREGDDLFMELPVSIYKAMLGGEQTVALLSGTIKVKIPPETRNGTTLRIKGKGFPVYGKKGAWGDLYIKLVLDLPRDLTAKEKELVKELAQIRGEI